MDSTTARFTSLANFDMSAKQTEEEYCDAVYELLLQDPEQPMTLITLGTYIPKPSRKKSSRSILAKDPRFDVTESESQVFVSLHDSGEDLPAGDITQTLLRLAQLSLSSGAMNDSRLSRAWLRSTLLQQEPEDNCTAMMRHYALLACDDQFEVMAALVEKIANGKHPVIALPQHGVAVSDGSLIASNGEIVDAQEEVALSPVPSAARTGGSVKPVSQQQRQQPPASEPESPLESDLKSRVVVSSHGSAEDLSSGDASSNFFHLRPIGLLPPPSNAMERAYYAKIAAAKRLPSCSLLLRTSPRQFLEWPHACIGPGGCPPLFPAPPLWMHELEALCKALPRQVVYGAAQVYEDQVKNDEAYLSLRNYSCETCKTPGCLPRCVCGEAYCSRECQLADWNKNHRAACEFVRTRPFFLGLQFTAQFWKHFHGVAVSDGAFSMCNGEIVDAQEEVALRPVPSAARTGGSVKPVSQQQRQLPPASEPESLLSLPPSPPSHIPTFYKGAVVRIVGLKSRADLNGCPGLVLDEMDSCSKRWPVTVTKGRRNEDVLLLAANMTIVTDEHAIDDLDLFSLNTSHLHDDEAAMIPDALRSARDSLHSLSLRSGKAAAKENVGIDWETVVKKVSACCWMCCVVMRCVI